MESDPYAEDAGEVVVGGRARRATTPIVAIVVLALAAVIALRACRPGPQPLEIPPDETGAVTAVAEEFLTAWHDEDWPALQRLISDPSLDAASVHSNAVAALRITSMRFTPGNPVLDGPSATVPFEAAWTLEDLGTHRYDGTLRLEPVDGDWRVRWWYTTVHPKLTPEAHFERLRIWPERAPILARDGTVLASSRRMVDIGVVPSQVPDRRQVASAVQRVTSATAASVSRRIATFDGDPDSFVAVAAVPQDEFEALRPQLSSVDGIVFRQRQDRRVRSPALTSQLLGRVAEITAEGLAELGEPYQAADSAGLSGLERRFETALAGSPTVEAAITDDLGIVRSLGFAEGRPGEPLRTTLDVRTQRAAQAALRSAPSPAALVALDASSGAVRAVASSPASGFNRALSGLYPPGSTFKIVTATAALQGGLGPGSRVDCPASVRLGGPAITNAGGASYGRVSLERAFAVSCNTTFARLGIRAGDDRMGAAAELLGFNRAPDFTLPSAWASFPDPDGSAELARAAIGQGRVQASPLAMASAVAAAVSGTWFQPTLLAAEAGDLDQQRLPAGLTQDVRRMMRAVVTSGTGTAADLAGPPVYGKTGSAQFGDGRRTHAWFVAVRGDLAVAVLVEGGGAGGAVAAPIARQLFEAVDR